MRPWRITRAAPADADILATLEASAFGDASWGRQSVKEGLVAPGVSALLAAPRDDATPCGFAMWRNLGGEAEILTLGVAPGRRRSGAGRALLAAILDAAAACGCGAAFLEVDANNSAARAMYEKSGFETVGRRRAYYRSGADAMVMRRRINSRLRPGV